MSAAERDFTVAVGQTVAHLSPGALERLVEELRAGREPSALPEVVATPQYRKAVGSLVRTWVDEEREISPQALALALECAGERQREAAQQALSIVWTGPSTDAVPVRRTDQALLELIRAAEQRLIVVSFAVYKVPELAAALMAAARRGVSLAVILESQLESGGKVTYEMAKAIGIDDVPGIDLYTWAAERRPETAAGTRASLHAKCAVADGRRLLVSSANLTEFALSLNIELGLLVNGGAVPHELARHLEELIAGGEFRPAPVG